MEQAVLFDLDGTLTSLQPRYVQPVLQALEDYMGEVPLEKTQYVFGKLLGTIGKKSRIIMLKVFWQVGRDIGLGYLTTLKFMLRAKTYFNKSKSKFELIDDSLETIEYALENYKVGIVTSAFREDVAIAQEIYPIFKKFDVIVTWDDVAKPKPNPEPILKALELLSIPASNTIYVGDLPTDVQAAKAAGLQSVAYGGMFEEHTIEHLKKSNPDFYASTHKDIRKILNDAKST